MTPEIYRAEIAALELSQRAAARIIGIDERTSRRYAKLGVPARSEAFVREKLEVWAESFRLMTKEEEER